MPKLQTLKPRIGTIPGRLQLATSIRIERLRGRAAVERRRRFLEQHPLCEECQKEGKVTATDTPDHKIPVWANGPDDLDVNGNALCAEHHDAKTKCEARMRAAGGWLATACSCGQHLN